MSLDALSQPAVQVHAAPPPAVRTQCKPWLQGLALQHASQQPPKRGHSSAEATAAVAEEVDQAHAELSQAAAERRRASRQLAKERQRAAIMSEVGLLSSRALGVD